MPLHIVYCSWPGGTMDRDGVCAVMADSAEALASRDITWYAYWGTREEGEGWLTLFAPSRDVLVRALCDFDIPFLWVTEVWHVAAKDLDLMLAAGADRV